MRSHIRHPNAASNPLTVTAVMKAYHYLAGDGVGQTVGIIELGGMFKAADLAAFCAQANLPVPNVTAVSVDNARQADGDATVEVMLDVEVVAAVAPGAAQRVYFAPNTDAGFLHAFQQALAECDVVSCSWGGAESTWTPATMNSYDAAFASSGVTVYAAAGDSGADDGTSQVTVDFPASSPHVIGCGGTALTVGATGERATEVVWDDNVRTSATGGGVSAHFPGRDVPDVAGNADPNTGYRIVVNGAQSVVGGTSAVAPLLAGLHALVQASLGRRVTAAEVQATCAVAGVCWDVTVGTNGAFRAGPGRDETTGFGVPDGTRLLAALSNSSPPPPPPPPPTPSPPPDNAALIAAARAVVADVTRMGSHAPRYLKRHTATLEAELP